MIGRPPDGEIIDPVSVRRGTTVLRYGVAMTLEPAHSSDDYNAETRRIANAVAAAFTEDAAGVLGHVEAMPTPWGGVDGLTHISVTVYYA